MHDTVFVAAGELRPDLLLLLANEPGPLDVLLSAGGLLPTPPGVAGDLARAPHAPLSAQALTGWRQAILSAFAASINALPQDARHRTALRRWSERISVGSARFGLVASAPFFTRLVCRPDETVVHAAPMTEASVDLSSDPALRATGATHQSLREWCVRQSELTEDLTGDVAQILAAAWSAGPMPARDLYLKVLAEYFEPTLESLDLEADDNPLLEVMTPFQAEAYQCAKGILRRYGGVFLADVVGLGKTYIGLAVLKYLQDRQGLHAVVVAPPAVLPAWEELAREFRVELVAVSHGNLERLEAYDAREVLLIDESHNFRNRETQRYDALSRWLRPNDEPATRQVILLSATPQNNRPEDVLHQLQLFPEDRVRLPFVGESLEAHFRNLSTGSASMTGLLQHVVVRRTRGFISRHYPTATMRRKVGPGKYEEVPLRFPKRISGAEQCLRYRIEDAYGGLYDRIITTLRTLHYPVHGLVRYVRPEHADDPRVRGLAKAGLSVRGLYKCLVLKRLESSVAAFRITVERLRQRLSDAQAALTRGQVLVRVARGTDISEDGEWEEGLAAAPASLFHIEALHRDIDADLASVGAMLAVVSDLDPEHDAKLERLRRFLERRPPTRHRLVLFTQFADTAHYLHRELVKGPWRCEVVTGSSGNKTKMIQRFAPRANRVRVPDSPIDLLVSTDALSEGLNLQDADTLVNYDLHWNPVRLIQRAGRIDRLGSEHGEIEIASFLPERGLESELGLEAVLRRRIEEFLAVFGEDSRILPEEEQLDAVQTLDAYTGDALEAAEADEEIDGLSAHAERILKLRREEPERYAEILAWAPGRRAFTTVSRPGVVATRFGWYWRFWRLPNGRAIEPAEDLAGLDLLRHHAQGDDRDAAGEELDERLDEGIEAGRLAFSSLVGVLREQRARPRLDPAEQWVIQALDRYGARCPPQRRTVLVTMREWILAGTAQGPFRKRARAWRKEELSPEAMYGELRAWIRRHPPRPADDFQEEVIGAVLGSR